MYLKKTEYVDTEFGIITETEIVEEYPNEVKDRLKKEFKREGEILPFFTFKESTTGNKLDVYTEDYFTEAELIAIGNELE